MNNKAQGPLFLKSSTGLQDQLSGVEKPISFKKGEEEFEIIHSLEMEKRGSTVDMDLECIQVYMQI